MCYSIISETRSTPTPHPRKKKKKDLSDISDAKEQFNRVIMYKRLKQLKDNEIR